MEDYLSVNLAERMTTLLTLSLTSNCPVMSGSMQAHISYRPEGKKKYVITISAPTYDLAKWRESGIVVYDGKGNYALSVNNLGAFNGKSIKSKHWVDKVITQVLQIISSQFNAEVNGNVR